MRYMYTRQNNQIVHDFFSDSIAQEKLKELGEGGTIKVLWDLGVVRIFGSEFTKELLIDDILDAHFEPSKVKKKSTIIDPNILGRS